MPEPYKLYGALGSPYSLKLRALMRYRRIPHLWVDSESARAPVMAQVKPAVIPVLADPDGRLRVDSTPIVVALEREWPGRHALPPNPVQAFIALLIEDFADEWLTKAMFASRWLGEAGQALTGQWLAHDALPGAGRDTILAFGAAFVDRQTERMALVGCTPENGPAIFTSLAAVLGVLEEAVPAKPFLFGSRPSIADFALYGQLVQIASDPVSGEAMRRNHPFTYRWLGHLDDLSGVSGEWEEGWSEAVRQMIAIAGPYYAPHLAANAEALSKGEASFSVTLGGERYEQAPFRYQLKCPEQLRHGFSALLEEEQREVLAVLGEDWSSLLVGQP